MSKLKKILGLMLVVSIIVVSPVSTALAVENNSDLGIVQSVLPEESNEVLAGLVLVNDKARTATYMITGDGVRLRSTPSINGGINGLLYYGTFCTVPHGATEIYADGYYWLRVTVQSTGMTGYVATAYMIEYGR